MAVNPWKIWEPFSGPEFNPLNDFTFEESYNSDVPFADQIASLVKKKYEYNLTDGTGPYVAVVLKVLSGPQSITTDFKELKFTSEFFGDSKESPTPWQYASQLKLKPGPVRIKAKIPNLHRIPWPDGIEDEFQISLFPEFVAQRSTEHDSSLSTIKEGALVLVSLKGANSKTGDLIGVYDSGFSTKLEEITTSNKPFENPCVLPDICVTSETKNLYAGDTSSNILPAGPPISKIKGKIKTGIYGDGTQQTKAHFSECLKLSASSFKHNIGGPAPGKKNAFIWIGHLSANGADDMVDRPRTPGRETIIYAPKTLDLTSPVEIKYYFHDLGGFGHPWINGPSTTIKNAEVAASISGNDFTNKIAPSIKDLIKDGRNFILVIPEMLYSRGFGTALGDSTRVENCIKCSKIPRGETTKIDIIRTNIENIVNESTLPLIKQYLSNISFEAREKLVSSERILSTFSETTLSGNFSELHNQVLAVLNEYIHKNLSEKIEYVSLLAEGAGAISLAAIPPETLEAMPIRRIDFIPNQLDKSETYDYFNLVFLSNENLANNIPSYILYKTFLENNPNKEIEFNYIVDDSATFEPLDFGVTDGAKHFFSSLGRESQFNQVFVKSGNGSSKKFHFWLDDNPNNKVSIACYVGGKDKAKDAFSMMTSRMQLESTITHLIRPDTINRIAVDNVPNHAQNISSKEKSLATNNYKALIESHEERISEFELALNAIANSGLDSICSNTKFKVYCTKLGDDQSILKYGENSLFYRRYNSYLKDKEKLYEFEKLLEGYIALEQAGKNKELVDNRLKEYKDQLDISKQSALEAREEIKQVQKFDPARFSTQETAAATISFIESLKRIIGENNAIQHMIAKFESRSIETNSECIIPESCKVETIRLSFYKGDNATLLDPTTFLCEGLQISPSVNNFNGLSQWIPYYPKKEDFTFDSEQSIYGKLSYKKIDIASLTPQYKTGTFLHKVRRAAQGPNLPSEILEQSPPIWKCLTPIIEEAWALACEASGYIPFKITNGQKSLYAETGAHISSYGLTINVDPFLAPYSVSLSHSVFTGAWTPGIGDNKFLSLMGVFKYGPEYNSTNIYSDPPNPLQNRPGKPRRIDKLEGAKAAEGIDKYLKRQNLATLCKGNFVVPRGANPTLWVVTFCEKSGLKWGNSNFLKRKQNGGSWTDAQKKYIDKQYGIKNLFDRIQKISWPLETYDYHSYFQFFSGPPIIKWEDIKKIAEAKGIK